MTLNSRIALLAALLAALPSVAAAQAWPPSRAWIMSPTLVKETGKSATIPVIDGPTTVALPSSVQASPVRPSMTCAGIARLAA